MSNVIAQLRTCSQGLVNNIIAQSQKLFCAFFCSVNMSSEVNAEDVDTTKYKRKIPFRHRLTRCEKILLLLLILVLILFVIVLLAILVSTDTLRRLNSGTSENGEYIFFRSSCCKFKFPCFENAREISNKVIKES